MSHHQGKPGLLKADPEVCINFGSKMAHMPETRIFSGKQLT